MNIPRSVFKSYRSILAAFILTSGSLWLLPAVADENSPTAGTIIQNQATGVFTDASDNSSQTAVSDIVNVTVAEIAGISATNAGITPQTGTTGAYRTNIVYFDFYVYNQGNDQSQLFIPATASSATYNNGTALPTGSIGQLSVIEYKGSPTATAVAITTGNLVDATNGSATGTLTGLTANNGGSVAPGGYVKVRVPVTIPLDAITGRTLSITLGNMARGQAANTPWVTGGTGGAGNDLYTQVNADGINGKTGTGNPLNGDPVNHRQETSVTQTTPVIDPPIVTITGTVWDDANSSGTASFTGIKDPTETGANTTGSTPPLQAILVDSNGKVLDSQPVSITRGSYGTYSLSTVGVQSGVSVILVTSTTTYNVGDTAPTTGSLPPGWVGTTPLSYAGANVFAIALTPVITKDFGIDRLPTANNVSTPGSVATPSGTNTTPVPTLTGSDPEDGSTIAKFHILTLPDPTTQGTLYYDGTAVTPAQITAGFFITDPTKLTFDPVDTATGMSFTYAAVDAAGKESTSATASITYSAAAVTIGGTVWNDKNNSAKNTFVGINDNGETGTNAVFGTTTTAINALLVNTNTGKVIDSQQVLAAGTYSFTGVPANTSVQVILSATLLAPTATAPTAGDVPTGWVKTSPLQSLSFNTGLLATTQDFGIRQKAKFVLVKRITRINGLTTNPNDDTKLTGSTPDTFNNVGNWPLNYLVGNVNAGLVKPNDTIEYTVYFLNNQGADATKVKICDPIRGTQDYVSNSLKLNLTDTGSATSDISLTDSTDTADRANFYTAGNAPTDCNISAATSGGTNNGGVAIGITGDPTTNQPAQTAVPGATGVGTPTAAYGLFRFTTKVKP
jgi:hypothetical protein